MTMAYKSFVQVLQLIAIDHMITLINGITTGVHAYSKN